MSRPRFYRQNVLNQVNSVSQKSVFSWLVRETEERFGIAPEEARLVALKGYNYLSRVTGRGESQIEMELTAWDFSGYRQKAGKLPQCTVFLTPVSFSDLELHRRFGLKAMQNARLIRLIEEAYLQGAVFDQPRLGMLTNITVKSIRSRLAPLLQKGIKLPILGQSRKYRQAGRLRSTLALEEYFWGKTGTDIMAEFFYTADQWESIKLGFARVATLGSNCCPESMPVLHPMIAADYIALVQKLPGKQLSRLAKEYMVLSEAQEGEDAVNLLKVFKSEHNFSPSKARAYLRMLETYTAEQHQKRRAGHIVYFAVADQEPPGKALAECKLLPVELSYLHPQDYGLINPDATSGLKWQRILRYTTEAKSQGAYLSQPDLAYLLGVHPSVIQKQMQAHRRVVVPTRGNFADMGPGVTHMTRIVELYLQGYTETQIKYRTGHSYESIEAYLKSFSNYVGLAERGMPTPLIRKAMGRSMRVIKTYAKLYTKFNIPDYQWVFMRIRRIFEREETAKKGAIT